ncbi:hypothetical protein B0H13DRAFT_2681037 [Mycena leptocephala]|nr:hypothetical protein B0H13DRAFT_2681037 [Mycena leptocephala]
MAAAVSTANAAIVPVQIYWRRPIFSFSVAASFLKLIHDVILGLSIPGVALSVLFLAVVAFLQWNPVSRPCLDRVSFRLLVYALVGNVIFGTVMFPPMKGPSPACTLISFLYATAPMFSASLFCCMAVNLQLVLIHGVNGNKMEKYYLLAAAFLCAACNIPPLVSGVFGWYAPAAKCWLTITKPTVQQHWMIGTQSVPMILMSAIEVVCFVNILIFTLLHVARVQRVRTSGSVIATLASTNFKYPIVQFRAIIVRIALYPLLSCFLSITACILSIYISIPAHKTPSTFNTNIRIFSTPTPTADTLSPTTLMSVPIVDATAYSIRPLLYALLAATDPAFLRAVRSLRQETESKTSSQGVPSPTSHSHTTTTVSFQWASKQLGKGSRTSIIAHELSNFEHRPSAAEEARTEEEIRFENIPHQL